MTDGEILTHLANIERVLTNMNGIGQDVKSIKKDLAELDRKMDKTYEKTISNSKDIEFLDKGIQSLKEDHKTHDDNLWKKIHDHEDFHKDEKEQIKSDVKKDFKIWFYTMAFGAVGSFAMFILSKFW